MSDRTRFLRFADVGLNVASAAIFAVALMVWTSRVDQASFAGRLVEYSLAIVLAWLIALGGPTRFVALAGRPVGVLASVVWQTLLICLAVYVGLVLLALALGHLGDWRAHSDRMTRLAAITPIALFGYIGREVSNIAYGRFTTAVGCFIQIAIGAVVCFVLMLSGILEPISSATLFLAIYYTAGGLQLLVFLARNRPEKSVVRLAFVRETGRTNLALGFSTLLLGNVDKILLGFRSALVNAEVAYVIADRLASAYATIMAHYSQSRIQSAILGRKWVNVPPVESLDRWLRHAVPSLALFAVLGALALALASQSIGLPASVSSVSALVAVICLIAYLKSGSGYAIRLLDTQRRGGDFNRIAAALVAASTVMLALAYAAPVTYILAGKLALHVLMLVLLRHTCIRTEATP